jgi:6-phosphogluconate dehydrogenase
MRVAVSEKESGGLVGVAVIGENTIYLTRTHALQKSAYCRTLHKIRQLYGI